MSHIELSNSDDWKLRFGDQDVRGYEALDEDGEPIGTVSDMIVDTDEERVDTIRLDDGTEYPARDISIGDGVVYVTGKYPANTKGVRKYSDFEDSGRVHRSDIAILAFEDAEPDYRSHYESNYGTTDYDYDYYRPAYEYGHTVAGESDYRDRDYATAENDLQTGYRRRYGHSMADADFGNHWETVKGAVRHSYSNARTGASAGART